jgi:hypothetical protein
MLIFSKNDSINFERRLNFLIKVISSHDIFGKTTIFIKYRISFQKK